MIQIHNDKLNNYLVNKGLSTELLNKYSAIFLDNGTLCMETEYQWLSDVVIKADKLSGQEKEVSVLDILKGKVYKYGLEGVTSAIFIPLFKLSGEFTGFSIRKMSDESKHDSWFIPGTRKIDLLYNLVESYNNAVKKNSIIVTEGVYDTIALCNHGFKNAVALLGTHMSHLQFFQLSSMVENIALCLDNDEAGIKAMEKIVQEYKSSGVTFWRVNIDKDPDEFLKEHGPSEFKKRISKW